MRKQKALLAVWLKFGLFGLGVSLDMLCVILLFYFYVSCDYQIINTRFTAIKCLLHASYICNIEAQHCNLNN